MADIKRQINEELERGAVVAMSRKEAEQKFGSRLAVASLGAVPKEVGSAAVRIIHDATHKVEVNNRIRVQDRLRFPAIDDLDAVLRGMRDGQEHCPGPRFALKYMMLPMRANWRRRSDKIGDIRRFLYRQS